MVSGASARAIKGRNFDALRGWPDHELMDHTAPDDVISTLKAQGYGGIRAKELPGAFTLSGALPATPEALDALREAWNMRSEERTPES